MNNKGAVFSGYMYVLLVFFLLSLAALLVVLNNTKKISNKAREGAEKVIKNDSSEIAITLQGNSTTCINVGENYVEPGVSAKDNLGNSIPVTINSNLNKNLVGEYIITYTAKQGAKEKIAERKVYVIKNDYSYVASSQEFDVKCNGYYTVELWGARHANGLGGYTKGTIKLNNKEKLYVYTGEYLTVSNGTSFNGGTGSNNGYPGGGATDLRLISGNWDNLESLKSRIMVAAGAGAGNVQYSHGGGLVGVTSATATAGTQTTPGNPDHSSYLPASFGVGGGGCGGGSGYYGAGGASCSSGGAGGSSFISGYAGVNAITNDLIITHTNNTLHYSGKYFINATMDSGINNGNGKAKITYVGAEYPKTNTNLNNVRYVKDCINQNNVTATNHWMEIQIIKNGLNLALGKQVIGTVPEVASHPYSRITDGLIAVESITWSTASSGGLQCVTIDLGKLYDVDEIAVWHYYPDGRIYNSPSTQVSSNNTNWITIMNQVEPETVNGRRVNAWN